MRKNTLKEIWANGGAVVNGWCSIPSSFSAEVMAHQGFDSICIDTQHGVVDYQVAVTMLQAISTTSVIPLMRVPWNDPGRLMKALDAGAYGVICPMINNGAEAAEFAALHCGTPEYAAIGISWGYHMTTVSGDSRLLAEAAGDSVARFRQLTAGSVEDSTQGSY